MNYFKPYAYLYRVENGDKKLISCFVVLVPAGKSLRETGISTENDLTRIEYSAFDDEGQSHDRQEEYENEIDWNGEPHSVQVIVGSGSGYFGGTTIISSDSAE